MLTKEINFKQMRKFHLRDETAITGLSEQIKAVEALNTGQNLYSVKIAGHV